MSIHTQFDNQFDFIKVLPTNRKEFLIKDCCILLSILTYKIQCPNWLRCTINIFRKAYSSVCFRMSKLCLLLRHFTIVSGRKIMLDIFNVKIKSFCNKLIYNPFSWTIPLSQISSSNPFLYQWT